MLCSVCIAALSEAGGTACYTGVTYYCECILQLLCQLTQCQSIQQIAHQFCNADLSIMWWPAHGKVLVTA